MGVKREGFMKHAFCILIALLTVLLSIPALALNPIRPCSASSFDLSTPVGIYDVSVFAVDKIRPGELINVTVTVQISGLNPNSPWYNWTVVEGVESISVSIVEAGIKMETYPNQIMITNLNATMIKPMPNYVFNTTSITRSLICNSTTLTYGSYSIYVLVKGFRYAVWGLSMGYSNFYIEKGASMEITFHVVSEQLLQKASTYILMAILTASALTTTMLAVKKKSRNRM